MARRTTEPFAIAPAALLGDQRLTAIDVSVYLAIALHTHGRPSARVSLTQIERFGHASRSSVRTAIDHLIAAGWVSRADPLPGHPPTYTLSTPDTLPCQPLIPPAPQVDTLPVNSYTPGYQEMTHPLSNHRREVTRKEEEYLRDLDRVRTRDDHDDFEEGVRKPTVFPLSLDLDHVPFTQIIQGIDDDTLSHLGPYFRRLYDGIRRAAQDDPDYYPHSITRDSTRLGGWIHTPD